MYVPIVVAVDAGRLHTVGVLSTLPSCGKSLCYIHCAIYMCVCGVTEFSLWG